MASAKVNKYMAQYEVKHYAPKVRKIQKGDLREYQDRSALRQAAEASYSDSHEQSREKEEDKAIVKKVAKKSRKTPDKSSGGI